jgi:hypothetical protein
MGNQTEVIGISKKARGFVTMRFCVESTEGFYAFHLKEMLGFLKEDIPNYNWIFSDLQTHIFYKGEEVSVPEFEQDTFMLSGEELLSFIDKYDALMIFGVLMAVPKSVSISDIKDFPTINENEQYWENDYSSPFEYAEIEIGFFDTTVVVITTSNQRAIDKLIEKVPKVSTFDSYMS